jgi:hypothetical protein
MIVAALLGLLQVVFFEEYYLMVSPNLCCPMALSQAITIVY